MVSRKTHGCWGNPPFLGNHPYLIAVMPPALCFFPQDLKTRKRSFKRKARSEKRAQAPGGPNGFQPGLMATNPKCTFRKICHVFFFEIIWQKLVQNFVHQSFLLEGMTIYETWNVWREGLFIIVHWRIECLGAHNQDTGIGYLCHTWRFHTVQFIDFPTQWNAEGVPTANS